MAQRSTVEPSCLDFEPTVELAKAECVSGEDTDSAVFLQGRYRIVETLGEGAFGKVLHAEDCRLERRVAIKQLRSDRLDEDSRARFSREAKILARMDHPNVVPIYDADILADPLYLVMKYVSGSTLKQVACRIEPDEDWILDITKQLATGLAYIHQHGVVHRDIKPENIILENDERPILVDFGLSRSGHGAESLTESGRVLGTLIYMAPEALHGNYSPSSDLYSLGATLYYLLFKETCFQSAEIGTLIQQIRSVRPRMLEQPPAALSNEMTTLVSRLLCKDPSRRFRSAGDLLDFIESWKGSPPGSTRALPLDLLGEKIEEIEGLARDSINALESSGAHLESALAPLSRLSRRSSDFLERIGQLSDDELHDPMIAALLASVQTVGRSVDERLRRKVDERIEGAEGPLHQLRTQLLDRAAALLARTTSDSSSDNAVSDFFTFDATPNSAWGNREIDWQTALLSRNELDRHEGMLTLLGSERSSFLRLLPTLPKPDRSEILNALWLQADLLLLEGRMNAKEIFEGIIAHCDDQEQQHTRWVMLFSIFRPCRSEPDPEMIRMALSTLPDDDRRVIGRSLLIHPKRELRDLACEVIEPRDYWAVVTHRLTPFSWIEEIWTRLASEVAPDFKKIFFVCTRHRLMEEPLDREIQVAAKLLEHFFSEDSFLERDFFRMLSSLNDHVRAEARRVHFAIDFLDQYVQRMESFFSSPKRQENPVSNWGGVPLPIQRMIARRGLFQTYFACHPKDPIAMEVLRYLLTRDDVSDFLKLFRINKSLLTEVAREARFFQSEHGKFYLVANPKTPAFVIARYIDYLNQSSLKKLAESRECNPFARSHAQRLLAKRNRFRSGGPPGPAD